MSKYRPQVNLLIAGLSLFAVATCVPPATLDPLEPDLTSQRDCPLTPLYFQGNSVVLRADSLARLKSMSRCLRSMVRPIRVTGHTDRMGSTKYRKRLGRLRALTVKQHLVRWGMLPELITTFSYGRARMRCRGDYARCAPLNRRVEINFQ